MLLNLFALIIIVIISFLLYLTLKEKRKADERTKIVMSNLINERKTFENTAHWYKSILDAIPFPITVTDANSCWTFVNTRVEDFLGVKFNDIKGKPCSSWGAHICNTPNCGIECAKRGIKQTYFTHNEASYKVDVEILKDINGETAGYIEIVQDITNLEEISKKQIDTEVISKAKSAFIATVSHEIRTPLNAIMGITDIQIQDQNNSHKAKEALIQIYNSSDLLLNIINDILDYSKIEAGQLQLFPINYDVPGLINDTVHINIVRINNKPIEFTLKVNEDIPSLLFGDELRIKQILNNILSNAFKYTKKGNVTLSVNTEQNHADDNHNITLVMAITDTGQGMTPEEINNMFNEYSRFHMETNRTTEGTGLGMSITKHLIRLMNGEIYVDSALGKGTTFTIRLPQKDINAPKIGKEQAEKLQLFNYDSSPLLRKSQIFRESMPYGSVLIVDDVDTNLYVAKGLISPYDIKIDLASSGFEAIEKIKSNNIYDIIFMDHMMPTMDGLETVKIIRETGYSYPIVALTANAVVGQAEIFLENGFNDFISKPIDVRQLNAILNRFIRDKQPLNVLLKAQKLKPKTAEAIKMNNTSELTEIFTKDAKRIINELSNIYSNNFYGEDDIHNYIIFVHSIKSALANVGETELSKTAENLEEAGREKNIKLLKEKTPSFLNALQNTINQYMYTENREEQEDTKESRSFLLEKIICIKKACAEYDKKTAKNILKELHAKKWQESTNNYINRIAEHLLHSEFDEISVLIDDFCNKTN